MSYKLDFIKAGKIARDVRAFGKGLIVKGASYNSVINQIKGKIKDLGARPAFPPQIALNDVAAHFLPMPDEDIIFNDEVIKLDVGVCYNGAIGDCAVTIDLSGKYQKLIDATEAALLNAEKIIRVGLPIREIGAMIEETIMGYGFQPVRNLAGHGLGYYKVHTAPTIPNYRDESKGLIKPNMTFAIEPFGTDGEGMIYEEGVPTIFSYQANRTLHSPEAKKLKAKIKSFNGLPFALHDIDPAGLEELLRNGSVVGYGPLLEKERGMVAQAENSVLVDEKGQVLITTR